MSNSFNKQNNGNNKTTTPNGGPPFAAHRKANGPEPPSVHDAALDGTAQQPGATPSAVPPGPEPSLLTYASFSGMVQQCEPPEHPLLETNGHEPFSVSYASYSSDTKRQPDENDPPVAGKSSTYNTCSHVLSLGATLLVALLMGLLALLFFSPARSGNGTHVKELEAQVKSLTIENADLKAVSSVNLALFHAGAPPVDDSPYSSPETEMIHANVDLIVDECNHLFVESETSELAVEILKQQLAGLNQQLAAANTQFLLTQIESGKLQHSLDRALSDHRATERERLRVVFKHKELLENTTGLLQELNN